MRKYSWNKKQNRDFRYNQMTDEQLKDVYHYLRSLNATYFNKKELGQLINFLTKNNKMEILC